MKKILFITLLLFSILITYSQVPTIPSVPARWRVSTGTTLPTTCTAGFGWMDVFIDTTNNALYVCKDDGISWLKLIGGFTRTDTTSNTDNAGQITLAAGTGTFTFTNTYATAPICTASDTTALNPVRVSVSTTILTLTGTGTDVVNYICIPRT